MSKFPLEQQTIFECFVRVLQQQSLLRIHACGVSSRSRKKFRIKAGNIFSKEVATGNSYLKAWSERRHGEQEILGYSLPGLAYLGLDGTWNRYSSLNWER